MEKVDLFHSVHEFMLVMAANVSGLSSDASDAQIFSELAIFHVILKTIFIYQNNKDFTYSGH